MNKTQFSKKLPQRDGGNHMQINREYEPEINLKDLFIHVLYRWRSLLIAALIGAILLGGYQYFSLKKVHDEGKLTKEERQYELDLQAYQEDLKSNRNKVAEYTKKLSEQDAYKSESLYINLNPRNVWTASKKYLIKVDQSVIDALPAGSVIDPADSILPVYTALLSGVDDETLSETFGTDNPEYIRELISVGTNTGDNTVTILVKGDSRETVQKGIACLNEQILAISSDKAQTINPHQILLIGEETYIQIDENLVKKQDDLAKAMENNQKTLQEARVKLDELESKEELTKPGTHIIKMSVIGLIVGAILLAVFYAFLYVINGRLEDAESITGQYGLPVFGQMIRSSSIHQNKGLDKLINKWELKNIIADNTVYDNIATLITKQENVNSILLASTLQTDKLASLEKALTSRLPGKSIDVQGDFLHNNDAVTAAGEAETVIIVEEKGASRNNDINQMINTLIISKAKVIGAVVL